MKNISTVKLATMVLLLLLCVPSENLFAQRGTTRSRSSEMAKEIVGSLFGKKKDKKEKKKKKDKEAEEDQQEGGTSSSITKAADDVELVVSGDGINKEEATKVALRSAIEQAFGVFVSANTEILNDELVKDEIATVSSGNIKHYEYLSENTIDGKSFVMVKAIVSIGKLITYSKSKGSEAELAGATFAQNVKLYRLNVKNEEMALKHLMEKCEYFLPYMFDYEIEAKEPTIQRGKAVVPVVINILYNENAVKCCELFINTLQALSVSKEVRETEKNYGGSYYPLVIHEIDNVNSVKNQEEVSGFISAVHHNGSYDDVSNAHDVKYAFCLRNPLLSIDEFWQKFLDAAMSFELSDGINKYYFKMERQPQYRSKAKFVTYMKKGENGEWYSGSEDNGPFVGYGINNESFPVLSAGFSNTEKKGAFAHGTSFVYTLDGLSKITKFTVVKKNSQE